MHIKCPNKAAADEAKAILDRAGYSYSQLGPFDSLL
jgi:hypothetical protein